MPSVPADRTTMSAVTKAWRPQCPPAGQVLALIVTIATVGSIRLTRFTCTSYRSPPRSFWRRGDSSAISVFFDP